MPSTRSSVRQLHPGVDGSNVTDYFGEPSPKRQKRGDVRNQGSNLKARSSVRMTTGSDTAPDQLGRPQSRQGSTRQQARLARVQEHNKDDDDESVNIDFNKVISAGKAARSATRQTVNDVQFDGDQAPREGAGAVLEEAERHIPRNFPRRRGRPSKAKQRGKSQYEAEQNIQTRGNEDQELDNLYEFSDYSPQASRGRRKATEDIERRNAEPAPSQQQRQGQRQRAPQLGPKKAVPTEDEQGGHEAPNVENDGQSDLSATVGTAEDSAFIEPPGPDEKLIEVDITIHSLGGITKTLGHAAWTGNGRWSRDPDTQCESKSGRALMRCSIQLNDVLVEAIDAQLNTGETDDVYQATIAYLRDQTTNIKRHTVGINEAVGKICTQELAGGNNLASRDINAKKRVLRDLATKLIPMMLLVMDKTCSLGPSKLSGSSLQLRLDPFTLQFLLRALGWARRLERSLARGLEYWPIDEEFGKADSELETAEAELKASKIEARRKFDKQLQALQVAARTAERKIQDQARQAARQKEEEKMRWQRLIRQREVWEANRRQQKEDEQRNAGSWEAFCRSTQALRHAPDPLKAKWDHAEAARTQLEASLASALNSSDQSKPEGLQFQASGNASGNRHVADSVDDDGPFVVQHEDDPFAPDPFHDKKTAGQDGPGNGHTARTLQGHEAGDGHDWGEEEERILLTSIRYDKDYNMVTMAERLSRAESDVASKAALFKALYRCIYAERGVAIPSWAL